MASVCNYWLFLVFKMRFIRIWETIQLYLIQLEMLWLIVYIFDIDQVNSKELSCVEEIDVFFMRTNSKAVSTHEAKILSYINTYFEKGQFTGYNNTFNRFIKNIKTLSDPEMHKFVIRYAIASIIKKNWDNFLNDIYFIRQSYTQYDMNIYL